jgi:hypothetical protein
VGRRNAVPMGAASPSSSHGWSSCFHAALFICMGNHESDIQGRMKITLPPMATQLAGVVVSARFGHTAAMSITAACAVFSVGLIGLQVNCLNWHPRLTLQPTRNRR